MGADLSRIRSNPLRDFAGVELQQGRVLLDADFNEAVAIVDRRLRAVASDILGRSTVSSTTPDAFKLGVVAGGLSIGTGRLYVDGIAAESHGVPSDDAADARFDALLAEPGRADPCTYATQPYLPDPPPLPTAGTYLVFLDVWDREVTVLEDPSLAEVALGGVDTSSRRQTVWQVRVLPDGSGNATCGSPDADVPGWSALIAPSGARLTTGTFDVPPSDDPCELPPSGGYRGLENQTYRIEIHDPGLPGAGATFKWSRDNASVASRVASMVSGGELELDSLGRDDVLRFDSDDWVEIIDDRREFAQRCGDIRRIAVDEGSRRITFTPELAPDLLPASFPDADFARTRNLRVRRWDQKHAVLKAGPNGSTSVWQALDAGTSGVIDVPPAGTELLVERGLTVRFDVADGASFRAGDHWIVAARTGDASVEVLTREPPRGIHHHYARLGLWDVGAGAVTDCRHPWPPSGAGSDCGCTECVTPASHDSGAFTIQDAVDRIRVTGGTVCLLAGQYRLDAPVRLPAARAVRIRGQGAATLVVAPGSAFDIASGIAVAIEDLAILSLGRASAISVRTVLGLTLQRLIVVVVGGNDAPGAGISLAGACVGTVIRDNVVVAPVAVQAVGRTDASNAAASSAGNDKPPAFLLSALLRIDDNLLWCDRQAVALSGTVLHLMGTRIEGNEIVGCRQGAIVATGLCGRGASMHVRGNSIGTGGPGITAGVDGLLIEGNKLTASAQANRTASGAGIVLRTGLDPDGIDACQVLSNQITGFDGAAISIESATADLIVRQNTIRQCGNGIVSSGDARGERIAIEDNLLADIGVDADDPKVEVVGIAVLRAQAAAVSGNHVHRVGLKATAVALRGGIVATGVQRLRIAGNDLVDIAPPGSFDGGIGVGIAVWAPYLQADVSHNHVDRESTALTQGGGRFTALSIAEPTAERSSSRVGTFSVLRVDAGTTLTFGGSRPFVTKSPVDAGGATAAAVARPASASVHANGFASRGTEPVVRIAASGDVLFGDNRCESRGGAKVAVQLAAAALIVNTNRVRGGEQSIAVDSKVVTVLGNITTGDIALNGGPLPAPWAALNVRG